MAKVLLFSDIHIHNHKKNYERLEDCLKALQWVFDTANKRKIKKIIFGGDILHERQRIDIFVYNKIYNILLKNLQDSDIDFYCLLGNHDLWFNENTTISGVYPFQSIRGFKVISNPETINIEGVDWDFLPFTHDPLESMKSFNKKNMKDRYLIGHISIDGALLNSNSVSGVIIEHDGDMVKISKDIFANYKHAFFGHYHKAQELANNVEYIGSPLELSFGEAQEEKHIIVLDTDKNTKEYIKNNFSPKHIYIKEDELKNLSKEEIENNFICLLSSDITSLKTRECSDYIKDNYNINSFQVKTLSLKEDQAIDESLISDAKSLILDEAKMIKAYVESQNLQNLDKEVLISVGNDIVKTTNDKSYD